MDIAATYHAYIDEVAALTGLSDPLLHVHAGLAIYVLAQLALGTRRGSWRALAVVAAAEATNEIMDRLFAGSWRWSDTLGDVAATLFWPTTLVLASRYRRARWRRWHDAAALLGPIGAGAATPLPTA